MHAQLIITIVAVPILICWGLPISALTFVGNLIFNQVLGGFLIISSLVFFAEILHIPNQFFISCLEKFTYYWEKLLSLGQKSWLLGFAKINIFVLLSVPVITFFILTRKQVNTVNKRIVAMSFILLFYTAYFSFINVQNFGGTETLNAAKSKLKIIQAQDGTLKLEDEGFFNKKRSVKKFLEFDLQPYILKKFGSTKIKNLLLTRPGISCFRAAQEFCNVFTVEQITLPFFDKKLDKKAWREFFKLKDLLNKKGIKFVRCAQDAVKKRPSA